MTLLNPGSVRSQQGATLIVALVILLVMTLIGVSNMRSSSFQVSMATYNQNRQQAFKLAESALITAEGEFNAKGHIKSDVQDCTSGSATCFDDGCAGGFCFDGQYSSSDSLYDEPVECALNTSNPQPQPFWVRDDLDVFNTASKHQTADIGGYPGFEEPKYIVEFMCYTHRDASEGAECAPNQEEDCVALYRFTALATSKDGKSRVMLQSVNRVESL